MSFLLLLFLYAYESDDAKGIPEFWLTAMKNVDMLADVIQVCVAFVVYPLYFQCDRRHISSCAIIILPSRWVTASSKIVNWEILNSHYYSVHSSSLFPLVVLPYIGYYTPVGYGFWAGLVLNRSVFTMACHWVFKFLFTRNCIFYVDGKFVVLLKNWYQKHHL